MAQVGAWFTGFGWNLETDFWKALNLKKMNLYGESSEVICRIVKTDRLLFDLISGNVTSMTFR